MSSTYEGPETSGNCIVDPVKTDKWDFLYSTRFWQLALVGLAVGLNFPFPNNPWVQGFSAMISVWFGGSVAVKTLGKFSDK